VDALNAGTPATEPATASGSAAWPRPWPASPARPILTATPSGWRRRFFLTCSATGPGQPAAFHPGDGNGRALGDNAFDIALAVLAVSPIASTSAPRQATATFPYLSPSQPATLPALVDLYFRQPQGAS
jgi:hypothetical protein